MKFSEKIIQARKAKALTQEDLAEAVGVSRQAVSKWETEEAKPDLDKLVAICSVLDLSMDYLCLDKESVAAEEPQPSEPAKGSGRRYLLIGVCIGLVAAILVGLLAMALMGKDSDPTLPQPPQTSTAPATTPAPDYTDMLDKVKVFDVHHDFVGLRKWHISFVPSLQVPGMLVQIAVHDNLIDTTYYPDTSMMGTSYVIYYKLPDYVFNYDFIAIITVGDVTVQLPLLHAESEDGIGTRWEETWKE